MGKNEIVSPPVRLWGDRVLVQTIKKDGLEQTASGIYVPASKEGDEGLTHRVRVIKISKKFKDEASGYEELEIGDVVLINQFAGSDIKIGIEEYKVLRATDIMGVMESDEE